MKRIITFIIASILATGLSAADYIGYEGFPTFEEINVIESWSKATDVINTMYNESTKAYREAMQLNDSITLYEADENAVKSYEERIASLQEYSTTCEQLADAATKRRLEICIEIKRNPFNKKLL